MSRDTLGLLLIAAAVGIPVPAARQPEAAGPPPAPKTTLRQLPGAVDLSWNDAAVGDHQHSSGNNEDYYFEGYNVYQASSAAGPWYKVATYDVPDSVQYIYYDVYDAIVGAIERHLIEGGQNTGLRFHYHAAQNWLTGTPFQNGQPYYFAVTGYSYEANHGIRYYDVQFNQLQGLVTKTLENDPGSLTQKIVPQPYDSLYSPPVTHVSGFSDAAVQADVFKPDSATGHTYSVSFLQRKFYHAPADGGNLDSALVWRLADRGANGLGNSLVLDSVADLTGVLHDERPLRKFETRVTVPGPGLRDVTYTPPGNFPFAGLGFGAYLDGAVDLAQNFFGSSLAVSQCVPVELRFNPAGGQQAYAYRRDAGLACGPQSYAFEGIGTVPFTAWDTSDPVHPRQVNVAFVQNCGDTTDTNPPRWLPDASQMGGREYLFVLLSSYQVSPPISRYASAILTNGDLDAQYFIAVNRPDPARVPVNVDVQGRRIRSLDLPKAQAGENRIVWDGLDEGGADVAAGVFFARYEAGGNRGVVRVVRLK